jgi:hydroxyacylglutathione hydrolase
MLVRMKIQTFIVGMLSTNCYVVNCQETREAIIIDPGFDDEIEAKRIFQYMSENALRLKFIVNTHGHPDHTSGNGIVKKKFDVPICVNPYDVYMLGDFGEKPSSKDVMLNDQDTVKFGNVLLKVMHTPGHTSGSISLVGEKEVFTGDTLFAGAIGRTDLPGSSDPDMRFSLKKLASLPDYFVAYPGHGPPTTIGEEKSNNPFLKWL